MSDLNLQAALEEASKLAAKLKEERDEAREKFDIEATEHMLAINKVCGERDEARAQAKKLEGAYEDATNYYARWSQLIEERDEARELAQQMSESNQVLLADVRFYRNAWEQLKKEKP